MAISEKQRLYGQVLVDFANATETDEAGLKYFENIQKAFGLPYPFIKKSKNNFPTLKDALSFFSATEIKCLNLISEKKMFDFHINCFIREVSVHYDVYSKFFRVGSYKEATPKDGYSFSPDKDGIIYNDISVDELKKLISSNSFYNISEEEKKEVFDSTIPRLIDLGEKISSIKISKKRYKEILEFEYTYEDIRLEHERIIMIRDDLQSFLDEITVTRDIAENKSFKEMLSRYNEARKSYTKITDQGILNEFAFDEAYFTDRNDFSVHTLEKIYNVPIFFCAVALFKTKENADYLKKCAMCEKFFIAKRLIKSRKFCSVCSKKNKFSKEEKASYMRDYRMGHKKQESNQKRNARIERLMDGGYSRADAERWASIDE